MRGTISRALPATPRSPAGSRRGASGRPDVARQATEDAAGDGAAHPFAALNTAFFADGYVLDIAPGTQLDRPIEIVHLATAANAASLHTRSLAALGAGSSAAIIEIY